MTEATDPPICKGSRWNDLSTGQIKMHDGQKWGPDYRALLKRYMALMANDMDDFSINNHRRASGKTACATYPGLSAADSSELDGLAKEIADYCTGDADE